MSYLPARFALGLLRFLQRHARSSSHRVPQAKGPHVARNLWTLNLGECRCDSRVTTEISCVTTKDIQRKFLVCLEHKLMASTIPTTQDVVTAPLNYETANGYKTENGNLPISVTQMVIFVLGGPGSGKGTQCAMIVEKFGFTHLSAGDLLRAEINSGSENGTMIQNMIKEGKIVPSEVTVNLLQKAMLESGNDKFLIDGFPRNEENRSAFERVTGIQPEFILFFDCPEEVLEKRLLGRNEGRVDDNIETIRKRFKVFVESSLPVISYYASFGRVRKIDAARTREEVFQSIDSLFLSLNKAPAAVHC